MRYRPRSMVIGSRGGRVCIFSISRSDLFSIGCPTHATWPKNNAEFWRAKILGNQRRDRAVNRVLKKAGWRVVRIWEHALTKREEARTVGRLRALLRRKR